MARHRAVTIAPRCGKRPILAGDIYGLSRFSSEEASSEPPVPMEIPMRSVNKICMSVLMLGAAAIAAPALAQSADSQAAAPAPASDQAADAAAAPQTPNADAAASGEQAATADTSAGKQAPANQQTAMNSSGDAAANANVSSVGDTSKKYHRASRAKDFRAEQKITQQLNQQAAEAAKPNQQTAMNQ
jgi:hypothetical protein